MSRAEQIEATAHQVVTAVDVDSRYGAIAMLRQALALPEPEPAADVEDLVQHWCDIAPKPESGMGLIAQHGRIMRAAAADVLARESALRAQMRRASDKQIENVFRHGYRAGFNDRANDRHGKEEAWARCKADVYEHALGPDPVADAEAAFLAASVEDERLRREFFAVTKGAPKRKVGIGRRAAADAKYQAYDNLQEAKRRAGEAE